MPSSPVEEHIAVHFRRSCEVLTRAATDPSLLATMAAVAGVISHTLRECNKVLIAGNGGSAADAQHIAAEFLSRFGFDRAPLPAIALTTDTSVLTAIGNDYGFEQVFERQVRGLGQPGDAFLGISTSGRSPNVITALRAAREIGLVTIGFTGAPRGEMHEILRFDPLGTIERNCDDPANPHCGRACNLRDRRARAIWQCCQERECRTSVSVAVLGSIPTPQAGGKAGKPFSLGFAEG